MEVSEELVGRLTRRQRLLIIEHVDGKVDWADPARTGFVSVRNSLLTSGLLRGSGGFPRRPHFTALTEAGRSALAIILGWCADSLVRAGFGETPLQVLARLKAEKALEGKVPIINQEKPATL